MTKPDPEAPMTLESAAGLEFEPLTNWDKPPTGEQWRDAENPHLVNVRVCWHICQKTKPELVEMIENMGRDDPELLDRMMNGIADTIEFFAYFTRVLEAGQVRMIAAGAAYALQEDDEK